ncbi:MAG: hypothetical protein LBR00_03530, partial [Clostridiales Family XIII bacterium]|nr:hypothetical protein [Clostridiales Family XIII bacterium]
MVSGTGAPERWLRYSPGSICTLISLQPGETKFSKAAWTSSKPTTEVVKRVSCICPCEYIRTVVAKSSSVKMNELISCASFDGSEHMEYRPDYGPEVYCGIAKIDGFVCGFIANHSGMM